MNIIYLDLSTTYIPLLVQCAKGTGDKVDPTVDNLIIYEEGGADGTFDSTTITGSPFDPAQINSKTGLWGKLIAKSAFTAGKWYLVLWEMTVDSVTTAKVERYFACNASQFKADVSNLDVAVSTRAADSTVAKDATVSKPGTAQTITAPADMALNSTVAKEATLTTKIPTALTFTESKVNAQVQGQDNIDFGALQKTSLNAATPASIQSFGTLVADIATAVWGAGARTLTAIADSSGITTLLSRIAGALTITSGKVDVNDKTGFSGTATNMVPDVSADVTAIKGKTDNLPSDPADESLLVAAADAIMNRIGAGGSGLTALGDTRIAHLDADVSSRNATTPPAVSDIADAVHDEVIEGALTSRQIQRIMLAPLAGKSTGAGTDTVSFRDTADAKNRITATVDDNGNRTAVTLDGA